MTASNVADTDTSSWFQEFEKTMPLEFGYSMLGILSQMGPFSQKFETAYSFGLSPPLRDGIRILFSLRNVCRQQEDHSVPGVLDWAVNHIAIIYHMREHHNICLVMEDYASASLPNVPRDARQAKDNIGATIVEMLNLCTIGWTMALTEVEESIWGIVSSTLPFRISRRPNAVTGEIGP